MSSLKCRIDLAALGTLIARGVFRVGRFRRFVVGHNYTSGTRQGRWRRDGGWFLFGSRDSNASRLGQSSK